MGKKEIEILIIEDEEDILELLEFQLTKEGYATFGFTSTEHVEQFLEEENPALMIVDRNLPGVEGSEFVEYIRKKGFEVPVIFLTAKDKENDLVEGFQRGGDDYISKPFHIPELLLRVQAVLRRSGLFNSEKVRYKDITLDIAQHTVFVDECEIDLTNLEFKLLHTFIKNPQQILDRDFLRDEVWGDKIEDFHDKTINVAMNRLKKKINPHGTKEYFKPIWGVGYKLL
jgi:DNA-binding response OmpR family regulator